MSVKTELRRLRPSSRCGAPTTRLTTCTVTSLMSSRMPWVQPLRMANASSAGTAVMRPNAVQFMASEMPLASSVAFIDGSTPATPANEWMRPRMVPRRPTSVATLPSMAR